MANILYEELFTFHVVNIKPYHIDEVPQDHPKFTFHIININN